MVRVAASTGRYEFRVLGPVDVVRAGQPVALGGRRQRWLLALLLAEPGRVISRDRMVDELWQGDPPPGAEGTLRVYVSRLRSALGDSSLDSRPPGYVLDIDPELVDACRFERLCREGHEALARGAPGSARDRLGAALELWRGPALADVRDHGIVADEARRLDELRLVALEDRIEADLQLGRHSVLVAELERLLAEDPLRDRWWHQLIRALYHSRRHAEALAACDRARAVRFEGLGLGPSDELDGLQHAVRHHQLAPAPRAVERHNLPAPLTSFVGREREVDEITGLSRAHRLVTLTGIGGAGKTRLALEVGHGQVGSWSGGVRLVDLTTHADPHTVASAVAAALGVRERLDVTALEGLVDHLRDEELLVLLDNCEHLADACGELVQAVLRACPHVRILATSRIALGTPGEVDFSVDPLPIPTDGISADEAAQVASVRLLLDRGRAVRRDFATSTAQIETVARICRDLDGLPLAIELAAARAKSLSVDDIAARFGDRLHLLSSRSPLANPRHQTIRSTIDWSHDLLAADEQAVFATLSVFAGDFGLDSAVAICSSAGQPRADQVLGRLVECSLITMSVQDRATRYRMLELVREYAADRLARSGRRDELRELHALHFLQRAQGARTEDPTVAHEALALLDRERDNMHAAMQWALASESDLAVPLAAALWRYWLIRGYRRQGLEWLEQALALPPAVSSPPRALALAGAALLARLTGDLPSAERLAHEGVTSGRMTGPPRAVAVSLNVLTSLAARDGDLDRAAELCDESVAVARAVGDVRLEALALGLLAEGYLHLGRYDDVREAGGRALALVRTTADSEVISLALARLGVAAALDHRPREATEHLVEAVEHTQALGFPETAAWCCEGLALVAAEHGDALRAARLLGAAESLRRVGGGVLQPGEATARAEALTRIQRQLSATDVEDALHEGRALSLAEAVNEAVGDERSV